ncbi:hypothetical protein PGT21_017491 [Puccinia graminis f. sp. tritici]|uniref:Uncharacterized protein n=1 Tax=Puccinia graminis f. sp. tritici TaxID=56615 RepID=A0A5B0LTR5_PUCGR|nr:hypothetical protein PGT21_017491 [Puccinia graminis f. sp. tritici]
MNVERCTSASQGNSICAATSSRNLQSLESRASSKVNPKQPIVLEGDIFNQTISFIIQLSREHYHPRCHSGRCTGFFRAKASSHEIWSAEAGWNASGEASPDHEIECQKQSLSLICERSYLKHRTRGYALGFDLLASVAWLHIDEEEAVDDRKLECP